MLGRMMLLKEVELRLISELMKNSRRSDRELAQAIGCSQPTVSRIIKKLEKEGIIREYTMIPDFAKLGYELMGVTLIGVSDQVDASEFEAIKTETGKLEREHPHASLMAVSGFDRNKNRLFITFYKDYSAYSEAMKLTRELPFVNVENMESFLVDLNDKTNYRLLSMSQIAHHLLQRKK
jgi:DNA-binding Lrp family transcriptional regulator